MKQQNNSLCLTSYGKIKESWFVQNFWSPTLIQLMLLYQVISLDLTYCGMWILDNENSKNVKYNFLFILEIIKNVNIINLG